MTHAAIAKARTYSDRRLRSLKGLVRGAVPADGPLALPCPKPLGTKTFLERRELGVFNVGGAGRVLVGGLVEQSRLRVGLVCLVCLVSGRAGVGCVLVGDVGAAVGVRAGVGAGVRAGVVVLVGVGDAADIGPRSQMVINSCDSEMAAGSCCVAAKACAMRPVCAFFRDVRMFWRRPHGGFREG